MILEAARVSRGAVVVAPPGSGKTTRIPPALARAGWLSPAYPNVLMLQPRRIAAWASADWIAREQGWTLGKEVGYHIRFDRCLGPETRLRVLTEGILNRMLLDDPFLEGVGAVILDEFHERGIHTDLAIALLREVRSTVREDLILLVMSATLDPGPIAEFLGGCPVLEAAGRTFPVAIQYIGSTQSALLSERVVVGVETALRAMSPPAASVSAGDCLVFLPGVEEIRRASRVLQPLAAEQSLEILPLHASLAVEDQRKALAPAEPGRRKVVLATNVAETSLTIDGVTAVIDTGLARVAAIDPARGLDTLHLRRISQASADQRAGRAGRTAPGICLRLWSEREHRGLPPFETPEIHRVDLTSTVLALHAFGHADLSSFRWFSPPPSSALDQAELLLQRLGAWDAQRARITPLGEALSRLPLHPRLGRIVHEAARRGWSRQGAALAALLSEDDLLSSASSDSPRGQPPHPLRRDQRQLQRGRSDVILRLERLDEAERSRFAPNLRDRGIDPRVARRVARTRDELIRLARGWTRGVPPSDPSEDDLLKLTLLGFPDRVCRSRNPGGSAEAIVGTMVGGRGVRLDPCSVVKDAEFFVAFDTRQMRSRGVLEGRVRIAGEVRVEWLAELFPESVWRESIVRYDPERAKVVGVLQESYLDLLLREEPHVVVNPIAAGRVLAETLGVDPRAWFERDEAAASWLARLELIRQAMPEADWPLIDDGSLKSLLEHACAGKRSLEEARAVSLSSWLNGLLSPRQQRWLEEQMPTHLDLPSGRRSRIHYQSGQPPVVKVRVQDCFGWRETPRLASGRLAVVLHLLAPNDRPVQITGDLASFWNTTYHQVRKDLRGRYPKHAWPEDPWTAPPGRPRRPAENPPASEPRGGSPRKPGKS